MHSLTEPNQTVTGKRWNDDVIKIDSFSLSSRFYGTLPYGARTQSCQVTLEGRGVHAQGRIHRSADRYLRDEHAIYHRCIFGTNPIQL